MSRVYPRSSIATFSSCLNHACRRRKKRTFEARVANISEDRLYELLNYINAHLFDNCHLIPELSRGFVRAGFPLVMEMLHKLLRFETIPRLRHEMGECLTQFTSDQFVQAFQTTLPCAFVERTERVSEGFERAFRSADIELRTRRRPATGDAL